MDGEQVAGGRADGGNLCLTSSACPPTRSRTVRVSPALNVVGSYLPSSATGALPAPSSAAPTGAGALSTAGFAAAPTASRGAVSADPFQIPIHSSSLSIQPAHQRACCASSSAVSCRVPRQPRTGRPSSRTRARQSFRRTTPDSRPAPDSALIAKHHLWFVVLGRIDLVLVDDPKHAGLWLRADEHVDVVAVISERAQKYP